MKRKAVAVFGAALLSFAPGFTLAASAAANQKDALFLMCGAVGLVQKGYSADEITQATVQVFSQTYNISPEEALARLRGLERENGGWDGVARACQRKYGMQ